ncbi:MAG: hypothetical protein RLP44_24420 [Aggregatilineales bacterium]
MPIEVSWYDTEKTIIRLDFRKPHITTWDEYHTATENACTLAREVTHQVAIVYCAYDATMPSGAPLVHIKRAISIMPEHIVVAISALDRNPFERMILNIVQKLTRYKIQTYIVSTPEEAIQLARKKLKEATYGVMSR